MAKPTYYNLEKDKQERLIDACMEEFSSYTFSDASINVVSKAEPAQAFGTLLQRSLLGEKRLAPRAPKPVNAPSYVSPARWRPVRVRSRQQSLPSLNVSRSSLWTLLLSPLRALLGQRL